VLLADLVDTSGAVAQSAGRKRKVELLAACLRQLGPDERAIGASYLAGEVAHKTGVGYAIAYEVASEAAPAAAPYLPLGEVDRRFAEIAALRGEGSARARRDALGALLALATAPEQRFLAALVVGELRQGALDGLVIEAIAQAAELPADAVRRAHMLAGDLGAVATAALAGGIAEIGRFGLTLYRPILPMLAQTADDPAAALAELGGQAALEHKLDGFRVQIHKGDDGVRVYSRGLNDVTQVVPEVVAHVEALPARRTAGRARFRTRCAGSARAAWRSPASCRCRSRCSTRCWSTIGSCWPSPRARGCRRSPRPPRGSPCRA
jgi:DNA ligase-1